jgi:hypothetical protein
MVNSMNLNTRHLYFLILIFLFAFSLSGIAQNNDRKMRAAFNLKLAVNEDEFYNSNIDSTPYILNNNIVQIYPGEEILI